MHLTKVFNPQVVSMLDQRRGRCTNIEPASGDMLAGGGGGGGGTPHDLVKDKNSIYPAISKCRPARRGTLSGELGFPHSARV